MELNQTFYFELLIFIKLALKINKKLFVARVTSTEHLGFCFLRPNNRIFVEASLFTEPAQSIVIHWIAFRLRSVAEFNRTQCNGLSLV